MFRSTQFTFFEQFFVRQMFEANKLVSLYKSYSRMIKSYFETKIDLLRDAHILELTNLISEASNQLPWNSFEATERVS